MALGKRWPRKGSVFSHFPHKPVKGRGLHRPHGHGVQAGWVPRTRGRPACRRGGRGAAGPVRPPSRSLGGKAGFWVRTRGFSALFPVPGLPHSGRPPRFSLHRQPQPPGAEMFRSRGIALPAVAGRGPQVSGGCGLPLHGRHPVLSGAGGVQGVLCLGRGGGLAAPRGSCRGRDTGPLGTCSKQGPGPGPQGGRRLGAEAAGPGAAGQRPRVLSPALAASAGQGWGRAEPRAACRGISHAGGSPSRAQRGVCQPGGRLRLCAGRTEIAFHGAPAGLGLPSREGVGFPAPSPSCATCPFLR